jgi:hypothetical protein
MYLAPVHEPFRALVNADLFRRLLDARVTALTETPDAALLDEVEDKSRQLLHAVKAFTGGQGDEVAIAQAMRGALATAWQLPAALAATPADALLLGDDPATWGTLFAWLFTGTLGAVVNATEGAEISRGWLDEWLLARLTAEALREFGLTDATVQQATMIVRLLTTAGDWFAEEEEGEAPTTPAARLFSRWLRDSDLQRLLGLNRYQEILWFNHEGFQQLLRWLRIFVLVTAAGQDTRVAEVQQLIAVFNTAEAASGYQVEKLLAALRGETADGVELVEA